MSEIILFKKEMLKKIVYELYENKKGKLKDGVS